MAECPVRAVALLSPNNPLGQTYDEPTLRAVVEVVAAHDLHLIADEIYARFHYDGSRAPSFMDIMEPDDRILFVNTFSKNWAMTGWRIGYCGGPAEIVTAMATIQSQSTSNASSIAQKAAVVALNGDQQCVREMNEHFKQRHDFVVEGLNKLPGVTCLPGAGTFYAFANVAKAMQLIGAKDDNAFAEYLLIQGGVAVVPGSGFGGPNHMRLSFACSLQTLEEALRREQSYPIYNKLSHFFVIL